MFHSCNLTKNVGFRRSITMDEQRYKIRKHLSRPIKIFSLTIDEISVVVLGIILYAFAKSFIIQVISIIATLLLFHVARSIKKGRGPKIMVIYLYWLLPSCITQFFLTKLPASHKRVWKS